VEIDEDAYPLLMAWEAGLAGNVSFYTGHIRPGADFIVDHGPAYGDPARAHLYLATADYYQRTVERWTVTTTGPDAARYFIPNREPERHRDLQPGQRQPNQTWTSET
jgi:hypothetical protein